MATSAHVSNAVAAARRALPTWRDLGPDGRANALTKTLDLLRAAYGQEGEPSPLKDLLSAETGKRLPEADVEVAESGDMVEYFIGAAPQLLAPRPLTLDGKL